MLHSDVTMAVVLYGHELDTSGLDEEAIGALDGAIRSAGLLHFVPGDTVYGDPNPEMTLIGTQALLNYADGVPEELTKAQIIEAKSSFEAASAKLSALAEEYEVVAQALSQSPTYHLSCCGPLCSATLSVGQLHPSSEYQDTTYKFHSHQDSNQGWAPSGVDGLTLGAVDWGYVRRFELTDEFLQRWKDKAAKFDAPRFYLAVRYD